MFEEHRKFERCILCDANDVTREHIFGASFARHLGVAKHWAARATPTDLRLEGQVVKGSSPITTIAPKVLCGPCNNERLSPLMASSLPTLIALSSGESASVSSASNDDLRRYFERVAIIIDVCTSTEQTPPERIETREHKLTALNRQAPPLLTQQVRLAWLEDAPLSGVHVYLGRHEGVLGLNPDVNIVHMRFRDQDRSGHIVGYVKRITMAIHQLAVCIDIAPSLGARRPLLPQTLRPVERITAWPPSMSITYDDYFALRHQDPVTKWLRRTLAIPEALAEIEDLSRREGNLTISADIARRWANGDTARNPQSGSVTTVVVRCDRCDRQNRLDPTRADPRCGHCKEPLPGS